MDRTDWLIAAILTPLLLAAAAVMAMAAQHYLGTTVLALAVGVPLIVAGVAIRWAGRHERAAMLADWRDGKQRKVDADRALFAVVQRQRRTREAARAGGTS